MYDDDTVRITWRNNDALAQIAGDFDMANVSYLDAALEQALLQRPAVLHLDFSNVGFMDSSALKWLLGSERSVNAYGGQLRVIGVSDAVRRLFEITGLLDHFDLDS